MKKLFPILVLFAACTTNSNKVDKDQSSKDILEEQTLPVTEPNVESESEIQTLTLNYNAFSCTCAQWSESRFNKDPDRITYWLEPATTLLVNADTLFYGELPLEIQVTGQIVSDYGYPKAKIRLDEEAKIFRYTKIKVLKNGKKNNG